MLQKYLAYWKLDVIIRWCALCKAINNRANENKIMDTRRFGPVPIGCGHNSLVSAEAGRLDE